MLIVKNCDFNTAEKDETKGMGTGWERFEFNKDAPLDDEEVEGWICFPCLYSDVDE